MFLSKIQLESLNNLANVYGMEHTDEFVIHSKDRVWLEIYSRNRHVDLIWRKDLACWEEKGGN